jgi:hypothetical protein
MNIIHAPGAHFPTTKLVFLAVAAGIASIVHFATRHRVPFPVERWARDKAFTIIRCELRRFNEGPFTGKVIPRRQYVCYVRVRDLQNRERSAWVRCTNVSLSNSETAEVIWDQPERTFESGG